MVLMGAIAPKFMSLELMLLEKKNSVDLYREFY